MKTIALCSALALGALTAGAMAEPAVSMNGATAGQPGLVGLTDAQLDKLSAGASGFGRGCGVGGGSSGCPGTAFTGGGGFGGSSNGTGSGTGFGSSHCGGGSGGKGIGGTSCP